MKSIVEMNHDTSQIVYKDGDGNDHDLYKILDFLKKEIKEKNIESDIEYEVIFNNFDYSLIKRFNMICDVEMGNKIQTVELKFMKIDNSWEFVSETAVGHDFGLTFSHNTEKSVEDNKFVINLIGSFASTINIKFLASSTFI